MVGSTGSLQAWGKCQAGWAMWAMLLLCLIVMVAPVRAQVVDVGQPTEWKTQLLEQTRIFKDPSGELDVVQVEEIGRQPGAFQRIGDVPTPGRVDAAAWWTVLRLSLIHI